VRLHLYRYIIHTTLCLVISVRCASPSVQIYHTYNSLPSYIQKTIVNKLKLTNTFLECSHRYLSICTRKISAQEKYLYKKNICTRKISVAEKYLYKKNICTRKISVQEKYLYKKNICTKKISVQEKYLYKKISVQEKYLYKKNICTRKFMHNHNNNLKLKSENKDRKNSRMRGNSSYEPTYKIYCVYIDIYLMSRECIP